MKQIYLILLLIPILVGCQSKKEPLATIGCKPSGEILFGNEKKYIDIKISEDVSKKTLITTLPIFSKIKNNEELLGIFKVFGLKDREPQFRFINYLSLKESEREVYYKPRQELTHSHDWLSAWDSCGGYVGLKKDGSLWQFGKKNGYYAWDSSIPIASRRLFDKYYKSKKIGDDFGGAKIKRGHYFMYAIKKDGSLWAWDGILQPTPKKFSQSSDWSNFIAEWEGHGDVGCRAFNIGLKKDGSLWDFAHSPNKRYYITKPKQMGESRDWDRVTFDCDVMYAQKKDGSLWEGNFDNENSLSFTKITEINVKDKLYTPNKIDSLSTLVSIMKKIPSGGMTSRDSSHEIEIRKDGTLWFPTLRNYETLDNILKKYQCVELAPRKK